MSGALTMSVLTDDTRSLRRRGRVTERFFMCAIAETAPVEVSVSAIDFWFRVWSLISQSFF